MGKLFKLLRKIQIFKQNSTIKSFRLSGVKKVVLSSVSLGLFILFQNCSQKEFDVAVISSAFDEPSTDTLTLPSVSEESQNLVCTESELTKGMNNINVDSAPILAACLNSANREPTVVLPVGKYYLKTPLKIVKSGTLISAGFPLGNTIRCNEDGSNCATLIAHPSFRPILVGVALIDGKFPIVGTVVFINAADVFISNIVFDGNKDNRVFYERDQGATLYFTSDNSTLVNSVVKNSFKSCAVCVWGDWIFPPIYRAWFPYSSPPGGMEYTQIGSFYYGTGMSGFLNNIVFENNAIVDSGLHGMRLVNLINPETNIGKQTYIPGWSDGLNVSHGSNVTVKGNLLRDNTDIDLIFGGVWNSNVLNNTIQHTGTAEGTAWTAIAIQSWPYTMGHYDGTQIDGNQVNCPNLSCAFGILIGIDPWNSMPELVGNPVTGRFTLSNNNITGPIVGALIARIRTESSQIVSFPNGVFTVSDWDLANNKATLTNNTFQVGTSNVPIISFSTRPTRARITPTVNILVDSSNTSQVTLTNSGAVNNYSTAQNPYNAYLPTGFFQKQCLMNPPYTGVQEKVREVYCRVLGREPELEGLNFWTDQVSQSLISLQDLHKKFYVDEGQLVYLKEVVDTGDQGFVISLYLGFLERMPEAEGLNFWTGQLSSGTMTRDQVMDNFLNSTEFQGMIQ